MNIRLTVLHPFTNLNSAKKERCEFGSVFFFNAEDPKKKAELIALLKTYRDNLYIDNKKDIPAELLSEILDEEGFAVEPQMLSHTHNDGLKPLEDVIEEAKDYYQPTQEAKEVEYKGDEPFKFQNTNSILEESSIEQVDILKAEQEELAALNIVKPETKLEEIQVLEEKVPAKTLTIEERTAELEALTNSQIKEILKGESFKSKAEGIKKVLETEFI